MEPNRGIHREISQEIPVHPQHTRNMDNTMALFLLSLLQIFSAGTAAPLPGDIVNMRSKIKLNAEQLVYKIERDFQVPMGLTSSLPTDNVDGLYSIVMVLEGYESLLSDTLDGLPQLKQEVSSLRGYLDHWKQGLCTEQRPKPLVQGRLAELQSRKEYIHTVSMEAVMGLKEFLNQLLKNLDRLETC